jgi:DNA-binding response OmpR family regulator
MLREFKDTKILVCDPDESTLEKFCAVLFHIGIDRDHLICTKNIKEALDISKDIVPDAVFIDLNIEAMQGYSICTFLNDMMTNDFEIPVILMAYPDTGIGPLRGVAMRGRGFINKPVQVIPLQNRLSVILKEKELDRKIKDCYCDGTFEHRVSDLSDRRGGKDAG